MSERTNSKCWKIVEASQDSIQVRFGSEISESLNAIVQRFCSLFETAVKDSDFGILELVPSYCAVSVYFNPLETDFDSVCNLAENFANLVVSNESQLSESLHGSVLHEIPVCYEGEFAPDMESVSAHTGLSAQEILSLHSGRDYLIFMLGFLPGFPYLGNMNPKLEVPRLKTPRTKIPAGSVAIGGKQTGVYPMVSPGGWQIIGRTPLPLYDPLRNPPVLYRAGDRIRFVPVSKEDFAKIEQKQNQNTACIAEKPRFAVGSGIQVLSAGACTTVQDKGRYGFQHIGISESGAMDYISFKAANCLVGNPDDSACLEATLVLPRIRFTLPCDFAVTGARMNVYLDEKLVEQDSLIHAGEGSILSSDYATGGFRAYIAFRGGILLPAVSKSVSTNLSCKIGGISGQMLKDGDELAIGYAEKSEKSLEKTFLVKLLDIPSNLSVNKVCKIRVVKAAQYDFFSQSAIEQFTQNVYTVMPESNRMGIRLGGKPLDCPSTDIISDSIPLGAVQITSAGLPVIMAADRQTCGGYAKIAAVIRSDMAVLAQLPPGSKVSFEFVSHSEADRVFKEQIL